MEKDIIYLSSLFHDIGKLIERSKVYDNKKVNDKFSDIKYSHAKYTGFFLSTYLKNQNWINKNITEIINTSSYHHNPKNEEGKIIQLADWLSSSERVEDEKNTTKYNQVQLRSIFGTLNDKSINKYYRLKQLTFSNLKPGIKHEKKTQKDYQILSEKMISEFKKVNNKEDLFFILEKYLSFVPAQTTKSDPDISLFDHSKLTAAIAICLYHQLSDGIISFSDIDNILKNYNKVKLTEEYFILINADLSGIQRYIFSIPSKKAGKSLKARSTYLILLMEAITKFMIDELKLEKANVIYNGGGNAYILAPLSMLSKVQNLRKVINEKLLEAHKGDIFCNIGFTKIKLFEFKNFKKVWERVGRNTSLKKTSKLSDIWEDNYSQFFEPKKLIKNEEYCSICHSTKEVKTRPQLGDWKVCSLCNSFSELTESIYNAHFTKQLKVTNKSYTKQNYGSVLEMFGYNVEFSEKQTSDRKSYAINDFRNNHTLKWKLGAINLPLSEKLGIKTFDELSDKNDKLAYLKLDVDNLGKLFINGLEKPSLSRMSVLSRMMKMFFAAYIPFIIKEENLNNDIYVVFSGGDDTFMIGAPNVILEFAKTLRKKFHDYVCGNSTITFSAGIGIFRKNYPLIRAADITEEYLENSKNFVYPEDRKKGVEIPNKDKISLFGEVFTWKEYGFILDLYKEIEAIVNENSSESRRILQKIINSTKGFRPLLNLSQQRKLNNERIWRLRYFLRNSASDTKERIIKVYEKMWLHNLFVDKNNNEHKIKNHQIITVSAKLADLQTRN